MSKLWLALYFPALPLEVFSRGQAGGASLAVSHRESGRERISRCNAAATACGIRAGQPLADALALRPELRILARDTEREHQALRGLAAWAYQFSAQISFDPLTLLLEVGASRRLFGGIHGLLDRLRRDLPRLGFEARLACALTPAAASLLARHQPGACVQDPVQLRTQLRGLPLAGLTRERKARELIQGIGLSNLGDCLDLPRPELARRIGPELLRIFDRVMGRAADPRPNWQPPTRFRQRIDLLAEISQSQALVFPARRLIIALCGFLLGHGGAAQTLHWTLTHRDQDLSHFEQGLLNPSRDPDHLLELFRERIERLELHSPVLEIELRVSDWQDHEEQPLSLPLSATAKRGEHGGDPMLLLERLRGRLGGEVVQGLALAADHRPEFALREVVPDMAEAGSASHFTRAARPLWLLRHPRPLSLIGLRPSYGGPLRLSPHPERIEGGWWDGRDQCRDYHIAQTPAGERLWIYRDRRHGSWFLHGLFL